MFVNGLCSNVLFKHAMDVNADGCFLINYTGLQECTKRCPHNVLACEPHTGYPMGKPDHWDNSPVSLTQTPMPAYIMPREECNLGLRA